MEILSNATITPTDDGAALAFEDEENNGHYRLTYHGDNLTITVADRTGRFTRVDRLTDVVRTPHKNGEVGFEGFSSKLLEVVGVPHDSARVSFKARGEDGCPTCH